jgi:transposase
MVVPIKCEGASMARKRIRMEKIRNIIRYKTTTDLSERQIAQALNVSRTAVSTYISAFAVSGLQAGEIAVMSDSELTKRLEGVGKEPKSSRYHQLVERFPGYVSELRSTGMTLQLLWEEYRRECPEGYHYSQFCYHFQCWRNKDEVRMHIEHKAGAEMFVDYAGKKLSVCDPKTGIEQPVEVFVAILGASELTYVEASLTQQSEDWIRSNERALWYFSGVVEAIIPDNLKSGVAKPDPYEPSINPVFDDFAKHYGLVIVPARVRKARDKALVENAVRLTYQRIYAPLRNRRFTSIEQLNEAIWDLLEEHNNKPFKRLPCSRRQLFEKIERQALKPLPRYRYPMKSIAMATVQYNYHIQLRDDLHYYSVPWYLYRPQRPKTKVKLVYDERVVAIYYDNVRIAQHLRDRTPNGYTTIEAHMPDHHRIYSKWNGPRFLSWAASMGDDVQQVIKAILDQTPYPQQAYKTCMGILSLEKKFGASRLNKACARAMSFGTCSYMRIKNILTRQLEEQLQPQLDLGIEPRGSHENVRGSEYFK